MKSENKGNIKLRTLIVDDMPLAREKLHMFLKSDPDIEIIGECGDGREAVSAIEKLTPDLLFLDVQMPELNGFGVLQEASAVQMPVVIFVTAYDEFALRAFDIHALDYLLKPVGEDRLRAALERAKTYIKQQQAAELDFRLRELLGGIQAQAKHLKRLVIKSAGRVVFLRTEDIDWIEAAGNYVAIYVGKESHLLRETLGQLEVKLAPRQFIRIHRSAIINVERLKELQPLSNGDYRVILSQGKQLTLSRFYRDRLMEVLDIHS